MVIIGGYGDLAKKYLWQGLQNLDESYGGLPKSPLLLYSSGRAAPEVINVFLFIFVFIFGRGCVRLSDGLEQTRIET